MDERRGRTCLHAERPSNGMEGAASAENRIFGAVLSKKLFIFVYIQQGANVASVGDGVPVNRGNHRRKRFLGKGRAEITTNFWNVQNFVQK